MERINLEPRTNIDKMDQLRGQCLRVLFNLFEKLVPLHMPAFVVSIKEILHMPALLDCIKQILHQHTPVRGAEEEYAVGGFEQRVEGTVVIAGSLELGFDERLVYSSAMSDQSVFEVQPTYVRQQDSAMAMTDEEQWPLRFLLMLSMSGPYRQLQHERYPIFELLQDREEIPENSPGWCAPTCSAGLHCIRISWCGSSGNAWERSLVATFVECLPSLPKNRMRVHQDPGPQ